MLRFTDYCALYFQERFIVPFYHFFTFERYQNTGLLICNLSMCGRYTLRNSKAVKDRNLLNIDVSYNIAPSNQVLTLTTEPTFMKWSYNPTWAKSPMNLINARSETLDVKPSVKMVERCLIIVDAWFEWLRTNNSEQPYFFI